MRRRSGGEVPVKVRKGEAEDEEGIRNYGLGEGAPRGDEGVVVTGSAEDEGETATCRHDGIEGISPPSRPQPAGTSPCGGGPRRPPRDLFHHVDVKGGGPFSRAAAGGKASSRRPHLISARGSSVPSSRKRLVRSQRIHGLASSRRAATLEAAARLAQHHRDGRIELPWHGIRERRARADRLLSPTGTRGESRPLPRSSTDHSTARGWRFPHLRPHRVPARRSSAPR